MAYRYDDLAPGEVYHICTRAVDRQSIFLDKADHERILALLIHCFPQGVIQSYSIARRLKEDIELSQSGKGLVDLLVYCVMSNHLHLLVKENTEGGTSLYMQRLLNSYAKYFNLRYKRSGPLFTGRFKAVLVDGDEQLLHVSRYIHLNPYVAHMIDAPLAYPWSSLNEYIGLAKANTCHTKLIAGIMNEPEYKAFVTDEADYARALADTKHLLLDYE
ncbi:MAG: transposase, partial [bacterium]|nr:transposase [bacterium]